MLYAFGEKTRHCTSGTSRSVCRLRLLKAVYFLGSLIFLFALAACDEYSPQEKLLRTEPAQQKELAAIVAASKEEYLKKYRGEDKESVCDNRVRRIRVWLKQNPAASGWIGRISEIARTAEGNLIIKINCGPFLVRNRVALRSDASDSPNTEISRESPIFSEISKLSAGDCVHFNGTFIADPQASIMELSFTDESAMIHPDFLMHFTRIAKCDLTA